MTRQAFHRGQGDPEGAVDGREPRSRTIAGVGGELLAQDPLDDHLLALAAEEGGEDSKNEQRVGEQDSDHVSILRKISRQYESDA